MHALPQATARPPFLHHGTPSTVTRHHGRVRSRRHVSVARPLWVGAPRPATAQKTSVASQEGMGKRASGFRASFATVRHPMQGAASLVVASFSLLGRLRRNGCTIGCDQCDGFTRGPIPDMTQHPCVDQGNSGPGPSTVKPGTPCAKQPALDPTGKPGCAKEFKATNCDPLTRSINRGATCGGPEDYYYYSPWRAPGEAPVFDAWSVLWLYCGTIALAHLRTVVVSLC